MFEVDDLDARMAALTEAGVRTVWSGDHPMIRGRHLHPGDIGGAIVSLDQTNPPGSWMWGGPTWTAHSDNSVVTSIAGYTIAVDDPAAVTTLWSLFGLLHGVRFVDGTNSTIDLTATDRSNVGRTIALDQVTCAWSDARDSDPRRQRTSPRDGAHSEPHFPAPDRGRRSRRLNADATGGDMPDTVDLLVE